ncbi:unnamed protein product [Paramecium primaurelia]|uniref:Anti-silencing function protein 1 n=2 Tax=Paramecium TaxID=5884 RepID=A0A8S1VZF1_9CILI|nr:unnamed protein product [Paramecium primaurelia]CAD8183358.1 unnamed protein product [Paramecium pentaurelia]
MAFVSITNIVVDDKSQPFTSPITMDIYFDVIADIEDEIEWTLLYIGSPKDEAHDQILDQFSMGPLTKGTKQFTLESNPPDWKKIPQDELLGITAFILTCSYRQREFFRVGYYVYNTYTSPENIENDPQEVIIEDIARQIFNNKPRITRFEIDWNNPANSDVQQQPIQTKAYMFQEQQEKQSADATEVYNAPHQIQNVFDS